MIGFQEGRLSKIGPGTKVPGYDNLISYFSWNG